MTSVPITSEGTKTVVLDGTGGGTVKVGPIGAREVWQPTVASVSASTNVKEASCKIYVGPSATPDNFVDGTIDGSTGDSTDRVSSQPVKLGSFVWAVWAAGDVGAVATLNVQGNKTI